LDFVDRRGDGTSLANCRNLVDYLSRAAPQGGFVGRGFNVHEWHRWLFADEVVVQRSQTTATAKSMR